MRLPDDMDENRKLNPTMAAGLGVVCIVAFLIIIMVLYVNREETPKTHPVVSQSQQTTEREEGAVVGSNQSPDDFDFWDMYPEATLAPVVEETPRPTKEPLPSEDGRHTKIINDNGEEEWVKINNKVEKNTYDFTNLVCNSQLMHYYKDGQECSFVGIDISKYQEYVDFNQVKKAGIDFCMIRVGARGYGTGQLILDEYFQENMKRASDAGLDVGVYFFSQAITPEEAIEEANMVLEQIKDYKIIYPIAFDMEYIENDTARVEQLDKEQKTEVARAFLDTVRNAGYTPMIYGDKEWLITKVDLVLLSEYDVWLSQYRDIPDYPYKFSMWQYSNQGIVDGISGKVDLNISFIDYSQK